MRFVFTFALMICFLCMPVSALEIEPPEVPQSGSDLMPENTGSFSDGLRQILKTAFSRIYPDLTDAAKSCFSVIAAMILCGIVSCFSERIQKCANLAGTVTVSAVLMQNSHALVRLGAETIRELSEYGKLLLPVLTSALAAQGSIGTSTALYTATAIFNSILTSVLTKLMIPMIYVFLCLAISCSAVGAQTVKQLKDTVKSLMTWVLKTLMTVFTAYLGVTGVVSGTTDAAALKATKMTISGMVPVVGGILSDASEAVLVSAGIMKNAAGIYGILATFAVLITPFFKIGSHYLLLKFTGSLCTMFGPKGMGELTQDFSGAMGLLLGMTGAISLLLTVSTVCFLRGVG